jgi:hypothetical protein
MRPTAARSATDPRRGQQEPSRCPRRGPRRESPQCTCLRRLRAPGWLGHEAWLAGSQLRRLAVSGVPRLVLGEQPPIYNLRPVGGYFCRANTGSSLSSIQGSNFPVERALGSVRARATKAPDVPSNGRLNARNEACERAVEGPVVMDGGPGRNRAGQVEHGHRHSRSSGASTRSNCRRRRLSALEGRSTGL